MELDPRLLIPEMILLAAACICTLMGLSKNDALRKGTQFLAAGACALALAAAATKNFGLAGPDSPVNFDSAFHYIMAFNPNYITELACLIGLLSVLAAWNMPSKADPSLADSTYRGEFYGMMLFSLAGVAMIGKVNDLVWLFIALELVSIPTYILVATGRSQIIAQEAGVKYFFLGALSAAVYLFGFSYLYGAAGSTRFNDLQAFFLHFSEAKPIPPLALIGILMVIVGLAYKIAAWPLHFYAPDVYQGAATPVTAFLAFAPKAAGIVAIIAMLSLVNFNYHVRPADGHFHWFNYGGSGAPVAVLLAVMSAVTMTVGNVMALLQRNIKRIFAYSSIAHSGYMLVGLVAGFDLGSGGNDGVSATIFYLTSYAVMNLGAFAVLIYMQGKADAAEDLDDVAGIARAQPLAAMMMALCLLSLIGMPLTLGFWGKFYLIQKALATGHTSLAVILVINAAIAAAYYLKIVAAMYLREPLYPFAVRNVLPIKLAAGLCAVAVVAFFVVPSVLLAANNTTTDEMPPPPPVRTQGLPAEGTGVNGAVSLR